MTDPLLTSIWLVPEILNMSIAVLTPAEFCGVWELLRDQEWKVVQHGEPVNLRDAVSPSQQDEAYPDIDDDGEDNRHDIPCDGPGYR